MREIRNRLIRTLALVAAAALCAFAVVSQGAAWQRAKPDTARLKARLAEEVRHQLLLLPYYGVFDDLSFEIRDVDTVVLHGEVTRPTLKSDAEHAVGRIEGAGKVINQIEVLPLSPSDDRIRLAAYRAIFGKPGLDRYALRAVPPIHIIVKNGKITLVGVVATEADKNQAGIYANGVPGVFSVKNDLRVEKE